MNLVDGGTHSKHLGETFPSVLGVDYSINQNIFDFFLSFNFDAFKIIACYQLTCEIIGKFSHWKIQFPMIL